MTAHGKSGTAAATPRIGRAIQIAWFCFAALAVSLALAGLAPYARLVATVCEHEPCLSMQLNAADAGRGILRLDDVRQQAVNAIFPAAFALLLAAFGIWRRPTDPAVVLLGFVITAFGAGEFAFALAREVPALRAPAAGLRLIHLVGLAPCLALLATGRFHPRWLGWVTPGIALLGIPVALDLAGTPLRALFAAVLGALGLGSLVARYRASPPSAERERLTWALVGLALLAGAQLLGRPLRPLPLPRIALNAPAIGPDLLAPSGMVLLIAGLACLGAALLRDELFEAELVLNRALVYGLLTICVVGGYVLVVGYLSLVFQSRGNLWLSLVATGVIAALFQPIRARLQRLANALLYGARAEPYAVIARLGRRLEATLPPEAILPTVVRAVAADLNLPYAAIALRRPDGHLEVRAAAGASPNQATVSLPLAYRGEALGALIVAPRPGAAGLDTADRRLLEDLARQAGAAAHAVRLTDETRVLAADLQAARERLVTAREEERRRLRRDLHDGLGPMLGSLTLKLGAARRLLARDPGTADALIADLQRQTRAAVEDIRRLVYALRPPALDELGLVEALRQTAASFSDVGTSGPGLHVSIEAPAELPPLPAAVEVAAYHIAREALANVARHAGAQRCAIALHPDEAAGLLYLRIDDDGRGLPDGQAGDTRHVGVGLASMRERAAELGGTCLVGPGLCGGTLVRASLPLGGAARRGTRTDGEDRHGEHDARRERDEGAPHGIDPRADRR